MQACAMPDCDRETVGAVDGRCTLCIHKGKQLEDVEEPAPETTEETSDGPAQATLSFGEEVRGGASE